MATDLYGIGYQNFYSATLSSDITAVSTTIPLDVLPTPSQGILVIDPDSDTNREIILYRSKSATYVNATFSDSRGYAGTTATSHLQGTTVIMAPVDKWFTALASGELSTDPLRQESMFDYIASGCVWSGDSYGSTRAASMTSGYIYLNGKRYAVDAVTARTFTASKDTYIDVTPSGSQDGKATLAYTEVSNNAASPALTANSIRLAIVVTGASSIANVGSINQGQENKVLPIASSIAYTTTDTAGNLICPRNPQRTVLGYKQITSSFTASSTSDQDITGLSVPVTVPSTNRKVRVTFYAPQIYAGTDGNRIDIGIQEDTVDIQRLYQRTASSANGGNSAHIVVEKTPTAGSRTYVARIQTGVGASNGTVFAASTTPAFLLVELV